MAKNLTTKSTRIPNKINEKGQFVTKTIEDRLEYVYPCPITGCYWWAGFVRPDGYGQVTINGKIKFTHRVFYEYYHKTQLQRGQQVYHKCGSRSCVNPDHLTTEKPDRKVYVRDNSVEDDGRPIYYLYRHLRRDTGKPFYVGIGKVYDADVNTKSTNTYYRRAFAGSKGRSNPHWHNTVENAGGYEVEIMLDELTKTEACAKEKEFVSLYGRSNVREDGLLCNLTDGGDGTKGWVCTPEISKKFSESRKGKPRNREAVRRMVEYNTGKKRSEEAKLNMREARKKAAKKIQCIETGEVFDFIKDAATKMFGNYKIATNIKSVLVGKRPRVHGYTFKWYED